MTRFADIFAVAYALALLYLAGSFGILGANWLDENIGYGLNPFISFPLMILCLSLALFTKSMHGWVLDLLSDEDTE